MKERLIDNLHGIHKALIFMVFVYFCMWNYSNIQQYTYKKTPAKSIINYVSITPHKENFFVGEPIEFYGERYVKYSTPATLTDVIYCVEGKRSKMLTEPYTTNFTYRKGHLTTTFPFGPYSNPYISKVVRENCFLLACQTFDYNGYRKDTCTPSSFFNIIEGEQ